MRARSRDVQREIDRLGEVVARLQQRDIAMRRLLLLPTPDPRRADCEIRIDCTNYTKATASGMTRYFGRTQRLTRAGSAVIAAARVDCSGAAVDRVKRAFQRIGEMPVDQMGRRDLPPGGRLLSAFVDDAGQVTARVLITDPVSVRKALGAVSGRHAVRLYQGVGRWRPDDSEDFCQRRFGEEAGSGLHEKVPEAAKGG
jgi:hypothetical protein